MDERKQYTVVRTTDGYENVRVVIVKQAVDDYRRALAHNKHYEAKALERWFLSEWGEMLCGGNGAYIIDKVKKQVKGKRK